MSDRSIVLRTLQVQSPSNDDEAPNTVEVKLSYDLGSFNHFYSEESPRGYYVSATPVRIGGGLRTYSIGGNTSGLKARVKTANRFSRNTFQALACQQDVLAVAMDLAERVMARADLVLEQADSLDSICA